MPSWWVAQKYDLFKSQSFKLSPYLQLLTCTQYLDLSKTVPYITCKIPCIQITNMGTKQTLSYGNHIFHINQYNETLKINLH
jgi:hypothetical protein